MFISVLMAVYNGEKYLKEAIESILQQTYTNFEFIIVNDGSTDSTAEIIATYTDTRIKVINSPQNCGLIDSLNKGIDIAKGDYIARLDADDIAMPERLAIQVQYLQQHTDVVLLGSGAVLLQNNQLGDHTYYQHEQECIAVHLLFRNVFIHSSVMVKTSVINAIRFDKDYYLAEDYILWVKIAQKHKTATLKQALVQHRNHETNITKLKYDKHIATVLKIYAYQLEQLGISATEEQLLLHYKVGNYQFENSLSYLSDIAAWLELVMTKNREKKLYGISCLENRILQIWIDACLSNKKERLAVAKIFFFAKLSKTLPLWKRIKITVALVM
jgi:glycosyltransferase involved in cell wall biosynthesis